MDRERLLSELPLPIVEGEPDAHLLAIAIAVAIEDAFDVVLTDDEIANACIGTRTGVLAVLDRHLGVA